MSALKYPTNPEQCKTCIFREDGNQLPMSPGRFQEIRAYLAKGKTHMCHTNVEMACRGGRQFQAENWHMRRMIPKPTIESLEEAVTKHFSMRDPNGTGIR